VPPPSDPRIKHRHSLLSSSSRGGARDLPCQTYGRPFPAITLRRLLGHLDGKLGNRERLSAPPLSMRRRASYAGTDDVSAMDQGEAMKTQKAATIAGCSWLFSFASRKRCAGRTWDSTLAGACENPPLCFGSYLRGRRVKLGATGRRTDQHPPIGRVRIPVSLALSATVCAPGGQELCPRCCTS